MGLSVLFNKFNAQLHPEHFIMQDVTGPIDYADGTDHVYALPDSCVLDAKYVGHAPGVNNCHVKMATNNYGNGRSFYLSGLRYNAINTRVLYRALLWCSQKESLLYKCFSSNVETECHYYPQSKRYALVNNTSLEQVTKFYDIDGNSKEYTLKPNQIIWIDC